MCVIMDTSQGLTPLIGMNLTELQQVAAGAGLKPFAAKQMAKWLYDKRVSTIDEMTDISVQGRDRLKKQFCIGCEAPLAVAESKDGTRKFLFRGSSDHAVEAVYIPDRDRATLCVSSQAGCKMNCLFCMTGRQGFHGNLSSAQIINQVLSVPDSQSLTNIVFMGMGEPTDNLTEVMKAIEILTAPWGLAWSPKRITVSSIGKLDGLKTLLDKTNVHIAISIHSPFPGERRKLMPVEGAFPITEVIKLLKQYDFSHQRRLSFEYIMWKGINDDARNANVLVRLLKGVDCRVNLIPYHTLPDSGDLQPSANDTMVDFRDRLNRAGVTATIRTSRGLDIDAACGMLAGKAENKNNPHNQN